MVNASPRPLVPAGREGGWIRPVASVEAEPRWGVAGGLQIAIAPTPGPRGLLRVFAPYLDHRYERLLNFIAVEPIPTGSGSPRGYSELEPSTLDPGERGKRFWSAGAPDDPRPALGTPPSRGLVDRTDGAERLTVWIGVERFDNGADVAVRVRFRDDRPHEVEVAGFSRETSVPLDRLILSATMGNWARLRRLRLAGGVIVEPSQLWPDFACTEFTDHARFRLGDLQRDGAAAVVTAEGDEDEPHLAAYSADTAEHWHFEGRRAVQGWRADDPHPDLEVLVNGRWSYWASTSPIPGGVSFENFEISEPFRQGAAFRFSVNPLD